MEHRGIKQSYQDSMKQLKLNKSSIERQNVDVTSHPGVDPKSTTVRINLPSHRDH
jgi:hypothetical protein